MRHGYRPTERGAERPDPPKGGSGIQPPPARIPSCTCQEITPELGERIWKAIEDSRAFDAEQMPDEAAALKVMQRAFQRLCALGFSDATYCPRDGGTREFIEAGSTGVHAGYRDSEGFFWLFDAGDLWPSHPILYRQKPAE